MEREDMIRGKIIQILNDEKVTKEEYEKVIKKISFGVEGLDIEKR